jgi:hypothetical protein
VPHWSLEVHGLPMGSRWTFVDESLQPPTQIKSVTRNRRIPDPPQKSVRKSESECVRAERTGQGGGRSSSSARPERTSTDGAVTKPAKRGPAVAGGAPSGSASTVRTPASSAPAPSQP